MNCIQGNDSDFYYLFFFAHLLCSSLCQMRFVLITQNSIRIPNSIMCIFVFQHIQLLCVIYIVVQLLSHVQLFATSWTAALHASLPFTISWSLPGFMSIELVMTSLSSVIPISSCLQSLQASGSFPMSGFLASGGQSIGASASASVLPINIQGWFPLVLTGLKIIGTNH